MNERWKMHEMLWIYIKYEGPAAFDSESCENVFYNDLPADIKVQCNIGVLKIENVPKADLS